MPNLLNLLPPELIPFITKYLPIQDLKNCCSLNDIWKTEVIREIRKRLIVDCTFVNRKTTVKALIDPKSKYGSISKALAQKMGLYITRMYGSKYPAVEDLGIGATNAGKKVMRRGWVDREKVSVTLPNIFELGKLKSLPRYLNETFTNFVVIDKPEYDLVLGSSWLTGRGIDIDFYGYKICRNELWEKKGKCYWREDSIEILPRSLHIFYEMLFPKLIGIDRDGDIILTCFSDKNMKNSLIDLSEYYDSEYSETESESSDYSDDEFSDSDLPPLVPDPLRVSRSVIFTGGGPNRMVLTNTLTVTDLISAIRVSTELTDSERINLLNSLAQAINQ